MLEMHIPTMSCQHCIQTISKAVMAAAPQASLHFDLEARRVSIDAELAEEALVKAVEDSGYPVAAVRPAGHDSAGHHCEHCA